jgi:hypothetical protein
MFKPARSRLFPLAAVIPLAAEPAVDQAMATAVAAAIKTS